MIPNPLDLIHGAAGSVAGWSWEQVAAGIAKWILTAIADLIDGVLNFLKTAARPDITDAWFSGPNSPYATVRNLAAVLMIAFLLAGIIQSLIAGDVAGMIRRVVADAPLAVLGMIGTTVIVDLLLNLTDALSTGVLEGSDAKAMKFLEGFGIGAHLLTGGFSTVIIAFVAIIATVMLWIELMVRSSLMYLLVAVSPLAFAASVWPAARGVVRKLIELMLAVILSKLVISIALAVGVAALAGAGQAAGPSPAIGEWAAQGLGTLIVGASIICLSAFSPFMILKLIPIAEGALIAQGMSRAPFNTARSTMSTAYYARSMRRLSGTQGSGSGDSPPPPDASAPPLGPSGEGAAGPAGLSGDAGAAGSAGASGGEAAAGAGAGAGAAGAAAGPAAVAVVAVAAAKKAKETGEAAYDRVEASVDEAASGSGSPGWQRVANEPPTPDPSEPLPREER